MAETRRPVVCRRLAACRIREGVSLSVAATGIGCTKPHLWELEMGKSCNPSLAILRGAARYYGVSIAYLVGESSDG